MSNAMELLSTEVCDDILNVDLESRKIVIPNTVQNLGVESDDSVRVLHFQVPRYYCEVDLSTFVIRINYKHASGAGGYYDISTPTVEENLIKFDWKVARQVVVKKGNVLFNVCFREIVDDVVNREFNTTIAILPVLEGLETGEEIVSEHIDVFEQLKYDLSLVTSSGGLSVTLAGSSGSYSATIYGVDAVVTDLDQALKDGRNVIGIASEDMDIQMANGSYYTIPAGTVFKYQNAKVFELVGEAYEFYALLDGYEFAFCFVPNVGFEGLSRPAHPVLELCISNNTQTVRYNGKALDGSELWKTVLGWVEAGQPITCYQNDMQFASAEGEIAPRSGSLFNLRMNDEGEFVFACQQDGYEYTLYIQGNAYYASAEQISSGSSYSASVVDGILLFSSGAAVSEEVLVIGG